MSLAEPGALPTADLCRAEMDGLYRLSLDLAIEIRRAKNARAAGTLSAASKAVEIARKALASSYDMARDREELEILQRYELLERKLAEANAGNRRAHTEERGN